VIYKKKEQITTDSHLKIRTKLKEKRGGSVKVRTVTLSTFCSNKVVIKIKTTKKAVSHC